MIRSTFKIYVLLLFLFQTCLTWGQKESAQQSLFLLSNLSSLAVDAPEFDAIQEVINDEAGDFTILVNGDFVNPKNSTSKLNDEEKTRLDRLIGLVKVRGKIMFVPGDVEWNHGIHKGWKKVLAIEKYLEKKVGKGKAIFPQGACLGPETVDVGKNLRIITINSQWFVQQDNRPEEEDAACDLLNEVEFWDELDDALGDADNRNIVVAMHHPALSYGRYAGYKQGKQHFSPPIIGSFLAAYHQNIGNSKDLNNAKLKNFRNQVLKEAKKNRGLLFVTGHEYDLQILEKSDNYHINSGAFAKARNVGRGKKTIYRQNETGFAKLIFKNNGEVSVQTYAIKKHREVKKTFEKILFSSPCQAKVENTLVNKLYNPCKEEIDHAPRLTDATIGTAVASTQYGGGKLKQAVLGKHYRSTWGMPVQNIPYLDLDTAFGGLKPYAMGGGAQTVSLKFKSTDGKKFAFRPIDKDPTKVLSNILARSFYGDLVQDLTSHQHPYGSLVTVSFMDELGLPHSMPKLYLMPDEPKLGVFRDEFAGKFGFLELKPDGKSKKKKRAGFRDADKVVSSFQMYQKMIDDLDNRLNVEVYVRARIFDMWIADWDRHEGNWKWLAYKNEEDNGMTYLPFAKDRDKAFGVFNGVYRINELDFVQKDKSNFKKKFDNLKSMNFKNRSMDRWLTNSYCREQWMAEAVKLQSMMTDEIIDAAVAQLPEEVRPLSGPRIKEVLQARRAQLPAAIEKYYLMLAKVIDIVGSNSKEIFEVTRHPNGDVLVEVFKLTKKEKKGKKYFSRLFKKGETQEIRLHGLGKPDRFKISGEADKSILIRIVSGDGIDLIEDESKVKGIKKMTRVYDKRKKDKVEGNGEVKMVKTPEIITFKTNNIYYYDYFKLLPAVTFNADDGFGFGVSGSLIKQGFNKPDFSSKLLFNASLTTQGSYNYGTSLELRHVLQRWDFISSVNVARRDRTFRRFYGLGNETDFDEDLDDLDFYKNNTKVIKTELGLKRRFLQKSTFTTSIVLDSRDVKPDPEEGQETSIYDQLPVNNGLGQSTLWGSRIALDLNFKDDDAFPMRGIELKVNNFSFLNSDLDGAFGGLASTEVTTFITRGIKVPTTLSLRGGISHAYGKTPFYYKSYLGQQNNHRGFLRNRYGGNTAAFLNTDLRFHLGNSAFPFVPIKYGLLGIFDMGRVWQGKIDSEVLHTAIGIGIYIIPYFNDFNFNVSVVRSDNEDYLFSFNFGFFVK